MYTCVKTYESMLQTFIHFLFLHSSCALPYGFHVCDFPCLFWLSLFCFASVLRQLCDFPFDEELSSLREDSDVEEFL